MEEVIERVTQDPRYYQTYGWPLAMALALAGVACHFLGRKLRKLGRPVLVDPATGQEVILEKAGHTFFFIKMHTWGLLLLAIAPVVAIFER